SSGAFVAAGGALQVNGSALVITTPISSLVGTGISGAGALRNLANNNNYNGAITLGGVATIGSDAGTLTMSAGISGVGPLTLTGSGSVNITSSIATGSTLAKTGTGTATLGASNSYSGATT